MKLELRHLRHILALDTHRNFARAAENLGLTQPALSHSLGVLEKGMGVRLFDRDRSRVEPTAVGQRLIHHARLLVAQAHAAERDVQLMVGANTGELKIGSAPYPTEISVGTAVGRLMRRHPGLFTELSLDDWPVLLRQLLSGELDIAIAESSILADDARFVVENLPRHRGVFFFRAGHPLASRHDVTLEDIREFPLVANALPTRLMPLMKGRTPAGRLEPFEPEIKPEMRVETLHLARLIAIESDAVGVALASQIARDVASGLLASVDLRLPWMTTNYGIIQLAGRTPPPAAKVFLDILREVEAGISASELPQESAPT
jgi:DNA-binding transcriptional LysR family regulator